MIRRNFLACLAGACLVGLTGRNTVAGVGKDMEKVGEAVQDAAKRH
jgi:predicted small secreted protein